MCRSKLFLLAVGLLSCALAPRAAAQTEPPPGSSIIAEIHATGSQRYTESQVIAEAGLKPGDSVTREQIQSAADHLAHLGAFSLVNFKFASHGDKITLDFELKDAPSVPVLFDNFPWLRDEEIVRAIREAVPLFDGTAPKDGSELADMASAITKLLQARGVISEATGSVQHRLVASPLSYDGPPGLPPRAYTSVLASGVESGGDSSRPSDEPMIMQFYLDGPRFTMGALDYGDALAQNSQKLHDRNQDLLGKLFSRLAIQAFEDEQVLPLYFSAGRLRVKFGEPVVHFNAEADGAGAASIPSGESRVSVTLPIEPGPVFHLADVTWRGNTALEDADLTAQLVVAHGDIADGMRLAAGWQRIENAYAHRGYLDIKVDPQPRFDDPGASVSYDVTLTEGPQYHMGDLVITGLSLTAERVLRAVWRQAPGDVFDGAYFDDMLVQIGKPNPTIFGGLPLHYAEVGHWLRPNPETHVVDVLLDFK